MERMHNGGECCVRDPLICKWSKAEPQVDYARLSLMCENISQRKYTVMCSVLAYCTFQCLKCHLYRWLNLLNTTVL